MEENTPDGENIQPEPVKEEIVFKPRKNISISKTISFFAGFALLLTMSYLVSTKVTPSGKSKAASTTVNLVLKLVQDPSTKAVAVESATANNGYPAYYPQSPELNQDTLKQVVGGVVTMSTPIKFITYDFMDASEGGKVFRGAVQKDKPTAYVVIPYNTGASLQLEINPNNLTGATGNAKTIAPTGSVQVMQQSPTNFTVKDPNGIVGAAVTKFLANPSPVPITGAGPKAQAGNQTVSATTSDGYLDIAFVGVNYIEAEKSVFDDNVTYAMNILKQAQIFKEFPDRIRATKLFPPVDTPFIYDFGCTYDNYNNTQGAYSHCDTGKILDYVSTFGSGQIDKVVVMNNFYGLANVNDGIVYIGAKNFLARQALPHEFGHAIGGLWDEYTYTGVAPVDIEQYINQPMLLGGYNCTYLNYFGSCAWGNSPSPALDCIQGCSYPNLYRSFDRGIMNDCNFNSPWGPIGENRMRYNLGFYISYGPPAPTPFPIPTAGMRPEGVMWCGNCNNYTCILGNSTGCAVVGDTDGDGNCEGQCGPVPTPLPTPQPCDPNSVSMNAIPNATTQTMNFIIAGDASTMLSDISTPSTILGAANFSLCAGTWNNKVCPVVTTGKGTWTHTWQKCAMGGSGQIVCNSNACTKSIPYDTGAMTLTQRPECGVSGITLSFTPDITKQTVTFKIAGDASTNIHDISAPSEILGAADFSKCTGTWNNKVCPVSAMGSGIWTHTWQKCSTNSSGQIVCDNSYTCSKSIQYNTGSMISVQAGVGYNAQSMDFNFTNNDTGRAYRLTGVTLDFQPRSGIVFDPKYPFQINYATWGGAGYTIWNGPKTIADGSGKYPLQLGLTDWVGGAAPALPAKPPATTPTPYPRPFGVNLSYGLANSGVYAGTFLFDDGTGGNQVTVQATYSSVPPTPTPTPTPINKYLPNGYSDRTAANANCEVGGWACDPDNYGAPLGIEFYNGTTLVGRATTNLAQETAVAAACGNNNNPHRYKAQLALPAGSYSISSYAVNIANNGLASGANKLLPFSGGGTAAPVTCGTWHNIGTWTKGCNFSTPITPVSGVVQMRVTMNSGGGGDCQISYQCLGSTGTKVFNTAGGSYSTSPAVCPIKCGNTFTSPVFAPITINKVSSSAGCNDGETMNFTVSLLY